MKRLFVLLLIVGLLVALYSCKEESSVTGQPEPSTQTTAEQEEEKESLEDSGDPTELEETEAPEVEELTPALPMLPYTGVVEHIFIHPLIPYPEVTFKSREALGFDDWFITLTEFNRILPELYAKGFILVDINDVYEEVDNGGKKQMQRKELLLPEGKKPLILSIDDVNYYKYMLDSGLVRKLVLDENGEVAALVKNPSEETIITRELEAIPILDDFVKAHPDFSHNGAKGILALTGYEGILGYRTHKWHAQHQAERELVAPIIEKLKATGWTFASHSYSHPNLANMDYNHLVSDTKQWKNEVELLVGPTQIYIYPFGARVAEGSDKFKLLQEYGFKIFCAVGPRSYEKISTKYNAVMTDRRHVDGMSLRHQRERFIDLYDSLDILDLDARPPRP